MTHKIMAGFLSLLLLAGVFAAPAFASPSGQGDPTAAATGAGIEYLCREIETYVKTNKHIHGSAAYAAPSGSEAGGDSAVAVCPVQGCTQAGDHLHDGVLYWAHHPEDGHSYCYVETAGAGAYTPPHCGLCPYESCIATGDHLHNGAYYSQHHSGDGHPYHGGQNGGQHHGGGHHGGGHH